MWKTALALVLVASSATADWNMNGKTIECYCTDSTGGKVDIGELICLIVDGRMFMAKCAMSLNVPIWRKVSDGCQLSSLSRPALPLPMTARPTTSPAGTTAITQISR